MSTEAPPTCSARLLFVRLGQSEEVLLKLCQVKPAARLQALLACTETGNSAESKRGKVFAEMRHASNHIQLLFNNLAFFFKATRVHYLYISPIFLILSETLQN